MNVFVQNNFTPQVCFFSHQICFIYVLVCHMLNMLRSTRHTCPLLATEVYGHPQSPAFDK